MLVPVFLNSCIKYHLPTPTRKNTMDALLCKQRAALAEYIASAVTANDWFFEVLGLQEPGAQKPLTMCAIRKSLQGKTEITANTLATLWLERFLLVFQSELWQLNQLLAPGGGKLLNADYLDELDESFDACFLPLLVLAHILGAEEALYSQEETFDNFSSQATMYFTCHPSTFSDQLSCDTTDVRLAVSELFDLFRRSKPDYLTKAEHTWRVNQVFQNVIDDLETQALSLNAVLPWEWWSSTATLKTEEVLEKFLLLYNTFRLLTSLFEYMVKPKRS